MDGNSKSGYKATCISGRNKTVTSFSFKETSYVLTTALHLDVFPVVHKVFLEYIALAGVLQP